ncbi:MAG TPA: aspartate/glutamate racemase family protein [Baekduia sp.]|nr:aspartate/glutamate racemase family protein [Baekduia sp.]
MRLLMINPNTTAAMTDHMVEAAAAVAASGTEVTGATVEGSVPFIDGYYDEALAAAAVARCVAERDGTFDAAIVACFGDPGLYGAREVTAAPVVGIAEASFALAMALGHRFGILSTIDRATPATLDLLRHYGLESRCAGVEPTGVEVLDLDADPDGAIASIEDAGRRAVAAGAEVLCLGCGAMVGTRDALEERLGVPVVEAVPAAVRLAESLVSLGLRTSKVRAFARPATLSA